jgi:hypothetical protein
MTPVFLRFRIIGIFVHTDETLELPLVFRCRLPQRSAKSHRQSTPFARSQKLRRGGVNGRANRRRRRRRRHIHPNPYLQPLRPPPPYPRQIETKKYAKSAASLSPMASTPRRTRMNCKGRWCRNRCSGFTEARKSVTLIL